MQQALQIKYRRFEKSRQDFLLFIQHHFLFFFILSQNPKRHIKHFSCINGVPDISRIVRFVPDIFFNLFNKREITSCKSISDFCFLSEEDFFCGHLVINIKFLLFGRKRRFLTRAESYKISNRITPETAFRIYPADFSCFFVIKDIAVLEVKVHHFAGHFFQKLFMLINQIYKTLSVRRVVAKAFAVINQPDCHIFQGFIPAGI